MNKEANPGSKVKTGVYHAPWEKSFDKILTFCPGSISGATATVVPGVSAVTSFSRLYCRQIRFPEARDVFDLAIAEIAEANEFSNLVAAQKPLSDIA